MLTGRDQWFNEGQPVMRHLRDFEEKNNSLSSYCIFIAPRIHRDTINTFWAAVKYEYEGSKQRIISITINDLLVILDSIKVLHSKKVAFTNENFKNLLDECIGIANLKSSDDWRGHISNRIHNFYQNAIAV